MRKLQEVEGYGYVRNNCEPAGEVLGFLGFAHAGRIGLESEEEAIGHDEAGD